MYDTLVNRILELASNQPDKLAVAFKKEQLTYGELAKRMELIARRLSWMGVKKGDCVLFSAVSKTEMVSAYLGIHFCGAVAVFIDKNATPENAAFIYKDTNAAVFLTDKPLKEYANECKTYSLRQICSEDEEQEQLPEVVYELPKEDTIAELLFTSGTTGRAKGVILTYKAVYQIFSNTLAGIGLKEEERLLLPLPLNHSFALRVLRAVLYRGATLILQNGFTFAKEIENNLDLYNCTALSVVPASVETISRQMQDKFAEVMGRFRLIEAGAGSLSIEQRKNLTSILPNTQIYNTWGSSETGGALFLDVTAVASDPVKVGALGKPLPNVEVKVLNEAGEEIVSDREHPGRMALKGDMQMAGYWNQPEETAKTLQGGWLLTGDMIYIEDELVYMLGRADDIINVGGEKVSPIEVENIASEYPNIVECACIGVPDPEGILGFVPALYVVVRNNQYSEDDIRKWLSTRMERYKIPVIYICISELPRNRMLKIDRKALRAMWESNGDQTLMNPVMQAILTRRSIRKFQDKAIPDNILEMILQAGYYAPSGHNMQTWRFTVIRKKENIQRLKEAAVVTAKEHKVYCYGFENPACLVLISNDERNVNGCQDASCAAENMFLAAQSYGIGSVWLNALSTLRNAEPVKTVLDGFDIPENHRVWSMVALGYPIADGVLLAKKKEVVVYAD